MAMLGLDYPIGSFKENLAVLAINRKKQAQFLTTLTIVNAIIHVGNCIQSALAGGGSTDKSGDALQKAVSALGAILISGSQQDVEDKAQRALKILEEEAAKGPVTVRPMVENRKTRGRIVRRGKS